ncbi:hypothetical protein E1265_16695 [Streptomyces sp. 8K308]|uniref:hypothetical protein n=1 Tax=Streptomyces sp. 8K308 TaxID=2530388 RepID=UPI001043C6F1|nr:hypothetical protein [Streptomyces sp. 8K308]TDC22015.1 hypothetical protein E1265_16695 [Streptomyces sp. 8K308]
MTTDTSDVRDARTVAQRVTMPLFKTALVACLLLGTVVVLCQAIGVAGRDAGLVSGVVDGLGKAMTTTAGVAGLLAFVMSYLFRWEAGGED